MKPSLWFTWPLDDGMEQINAYAFYALGSTLRDCREAAILPLRLWYQAARDLRSQLEVLRNGSAKFKLKESSAAAAALIEALDRVDAEVNPYMDIAESSVEPYRLPDDIRIPFQNATFVFEQAIALELGRAPIFYVTDRGIYDTRALIADPNAVYDEYRDLVPEQTLFDTLEAGKCLAFNLPTAAGFHIARATESVIQAYLRVLKCPPKEFEKTNWGKYVKLLGIYKGDAKIARHVDQIRDLERNPLIHPEETLTIGEAHRLFASCTNLSASMLREIRAKTPPKRKKKGP